MLHKKMRNYLLQRDGTFYYRRRVPVDLRQHFACDVVCVSLHTKNASVARKAVRLMNDKAETQWLSLRLMHMELPIKTKFSVATQQPEDSSPDIIEAAEIYLRLKRIDDKVIQRTARRNASYVVEAIGNKPITSYATNEAGQFRDWCFAKGMSVSSVKRVFNSGQSTKIMPSMILILFNDLSENHIECVFYEVSCCVLFQKAICAVNEKGYSCLQALNLDILANMYILYKGADHA